MAVNAKKYLKLALPVILLSGSLVFAVSAEPDDYVAKEEAQEAAPRPRTIHYGPAGQLILENQQQYRIQNPTTGGQAFSQANGNEALAEAPAAPPTPTIWSLRFRCQPQSGQFRYLNLSEMKDSATNQVDLQIYRDKRGRDLGYQIISGGGDMAVISSYNNVLRHYNYLRYAEMIRTTNSANQNDYQQKLKDVRKTYMKEHWEFAKTVEDAQKQIRAYNDAQAKARAEAAEFARAQEQARAQLQNQEAGAQSVSAIPLSGTIKVQNFGPAPTLPADPEDLKAELAAIEKPEVMAGPDQSLQFTAVYDSRTDHKYNAPITGLGMKIGQQSIARMFCKQNDHTLSTTFRLKPGDPGYQGAKVESNSQQMELRTGKYCDSQDVEGTLVFDELTNGPSQYNVRCTKTFESEVDATTFLNPKLIYLLNY